MRLIFDSDVTNALQENREKFGVLAMPIEDVICDIVSNLPTIDAVPVVRCAECKKYEPIFEGFIGRCKLCGLMREIDYCSLGERRKE